MNSIKIEKYAIEALKRTVLSHEKMDEYLQSNDKGPSWDGNIYIYSHKDFKAEYIEYIIPTQVKGKNDETLLNRNNITYPVEYRHLRNYLHNGGVCYFVIIVSDDGERTSIFYSSLTPIKLASYLKGAEKKRANQTKNITLNRLKKNDKNELYKILLQFGHDSKEQGSGELVKKALSFKDLPKIDLIRTTTFVSDNEQAINMMSTGEACLFGHLLESDMWVPFSYDTQIKMDLSPHKIINDTFGVDGQVFYTSYELFKNKEGSFIVKLSENLSINMDKCTFSLKTVTDLEKLIQDVHFLKAMQQSNSLYIGNHKIADYSNVKFDNQMEEALSDISEMYSATIKYNIQIDERLECFTEDDWNAMYELVKLHRGKIIPKNKTTWHIWKWKEKILPFFIVKTKEGKVFAENGLYMNKYIIKARGKSGEYVVPSFINFKREIWEKLFYINEGDVLEQLEKSEVNKETEGNFSTLFLEILSAYDKTNNEKYYNISKWISDKLFLLDSDNDYWKINKFQLLKRKRELSEDELKELEDMDQKTDDKKLLCAVNILLENKRNAKKILENMSEANREEFMDYPIYSLL